MIPGTFTASTGDYALYAVYMHGHAVSGTMPGSGVGGKRVGTGGRGDSRKKERSEAKEGVKKRVGRRRGVDYSEEEREDKDEELGKKKKEEEKRKGSLGSKA